MFHRRRRHHRNQGWPPVSGHRRGAAPHRRRRLAKCDERWLVAGVSNELTESGSGGEVLKSSTMPETEYLDGVSLGCSGRLLASRPNSTLSACHASIPHATPKASAGTSTTTRHVRHDAGTLSHAAWRMDRIRRLKPRRTYRSMRLEPRAVVAHCRTGRACARPACRQLDRDLANAPASR